MKIDIETLNNVLKERIEDDVRKTILDDLTKVADEEKEKGGGDEKPPREKKELVVVVTYTGEKPNVEDYCSFVVAVPEDSNIFELPTKIHNAAKSFNGTKKGRRSPIRTVGDCFESAGAKHWKPDNVQVKSKRVCRIIAVNNELP